MKKINEQHLFLVSNNHSMSREREIASPVCIIIMESKQTIKYIFMLIVSTNWRCVVGII